MTDVRGDCFEKAIDVVQEMLDRGYTEVFLVHGLPIGTGEKNKGLRYWHAWVEVRVPDDAKGGKLAWAVADWSNDHSQIFIARTAYYKMGKIPQHRVFRYTLPIAANHITETGHAGPWVPNADELEEVSL